MDDAYISLSKNQNPLFDGPSKQNQQMPKLRVVLVTYNHEKFITQALDSVLSQETNFDYDTVVLEDCSTDSTRTILKEYQEKHPKNLHLVLAEQNQNSNESWLRAFQEAPSEYVATLDGDDFWTSPHKLQKQVDFLESHPECSMCFHNVRVFYEDKSHESYDFTSPEQKEISGLREILLGNCINGSSPVFRTSVFENLPDWLLTLKWADWGAYVWAAHHGNLGYIKEIIGAYRIHWKGFYSGMSWIDQLGGTIQFYQTMKKHLDPKYRKPIKAMLSKQYYELAMEYENQKDIPKAKVWLRRSVIEYPFNRFVRMRDLLKMWNRLQSSSRHQS